MPESSEAGLRFNSNELSSKSMAMRLVKRSGVNGRHAVWLFSSVICITGSGDIAAQDSQTTHAHSIAQTVTDEVPVVIARGGASGYLPEQTTEATVFAHALGADDISLQVSLSKDGIPVVFHDQVLPTTSTQSRKVADLTLAELRQLSVRPPMDSPAGRFPSDRGRFAIATLEDHLQLIQGLNHSRHRTCGICIKIGAAIKGQQTSTDDVRRVLEVLKSCGYQKQQDRASLMTDDEVLALAIRTELKCPLTMIQEFKVIPTPEQLQKTSRVADIIALPLPLIVKTSDEGTHRLAEVVAAAHGLSLQVYVSPFATDRLPELGETVESLLTRLVRDGGVDGVFTDQPDVVLQWRSERQGQRRARTPFRLLNSQSDSSDER
ncbi:MAG: glycerophosphodiester phosphodiesterase family protein [Planctomycetaceae bacterium]